MRRGIVLFITLAILLLLSTIIILFLKEGGSVKKSVRENIAIIQTNLLLDDMSGFLKKQTFSQEDIFYGSNIPVNLDLGPVNGSISMTSAQNRININLFIEAVMHDQKALSGFLNWLDMLKLKNPTLLVSLLLDSYDKDRYERMAGSEIVLEKPWFQNGSIQNSRALLSILRRYAQISRDENLQTERWLTVFGFKGDKLDLNYANTDQLTLLYPEFSTITIAVLAKHDTHYKSVEDIPIDSESGLSLLTPRFGIFPTLKTDSIAVSIDFKTTQECTGTMDFSMELKKKRITDISLSPIICP